MIRNINQNIYSPITFSLVSDCQTTLWKQYHSLLLFKDKHNICDNLTFHVEQHK